MIIAMYFVVVLIGYLLGSIPFGVLISKLKTGTDIRQVGSGKIGTTNVLRTAGKKAAALVLIFDIAKGALPVIFAGLIFGSKYPAGTGNGLPWMTTTAQVLAALAAIAGHNWSIFLKFKGGRGVATFLGGLLAMSWPAAVLGGAFMIVVAGTTRYMSLGSIIGAVAALITITALNILNSYPIEYVIYTMICAIFIFIMHRDNILRLVTGKERRLGEKIRTDNSPLPSTHK